MKGGRKKGNKWGWIGIDRRGKGSGQRGIRSNEFQPKMTYYKIHRFLFVTNNCLNDRFMPLT